MDGFRQNISILCRVSAPLAGVFLAQHLLVTIETSTVARLNLAAVPGVSAAMSVFVFLFLACVGVVVGFIPGISQAYGAGNIAAARRVFGGSLIAAGLVVAVVIVTASFLIDTSSLLDLPEFDRTIMNLWLAGAMPGLIPMTLFVAFRSLSSILETTILITASTVLIIPASVVLQMFWVLDPTLSLEAAVERSGWASAITRWGMVAVFLPLTLHGSIFRFLASKDVFVGGWYHPWFRDLVASGPVALRIVLSEGSVQIAIFLATIVGAFGVTLHTVLLRITGVLIVVSMGLSSALAAQIGVAVGAKRFHKASSLIWAGFAIQTGFSALVFVFLLSFQELILTGLLGQTATSDLVAEFDATVLMCVISGYVTLQGYQTISVGGLLGMSETKQPLLAVIVGGWIIGLCGGAACLVLVENSIGLLWGALITGQVFVAVWSLLLLRSRLLQMAENN